MSDKTNTEEELKYSLDNVVAFRDSAHTYFLTSSEKTRFTSCTTYFKQFEEKKNWRTIAADYGRKHDMTRAKVLKMWDENRDQAATQGTAIHLMLENLILGLPYDKAVEQFPKHKVALKFYNDYFKSGKWKPVEVEGILYHLELMLAGQRDLKFIDEEGRLCIGDYKTNAALRPAFNDGGKVSMLLPPYNTLDESHMSKYSLQMALYDFMDPDDIYKRYIIHIKEDDYEIIEALPINLDIEDGRLQLHRSHKFIIEEEVKPPLVRFSKFKV